jgi:long-chain acyl-CoA synthetase
MLNDLCPEMDDADIPSRRIRFIGIWGKNSQEWLLADDACIHFNITSVPYYETLGEESIAFMTNNTKVSTIICVNNKVSKISKIAKNGHVPTLKNLVLFNEPTQEEKDTAANAGLKIYIFQDLLDEGKTSNLEF